MPKPASPAPSFAALVQAYFAEYLTQQRALSPQTVAAYRDAMVLFLQFAQSHLGKAPVAMTLAELTPELLTAYLDHLEQQRHNCVRSRNARLAALRSFLKFASHRDVAALEIVERALGIPVKRFERPMFGYLSPEEMQAVIQAPPSNWIGQRDHLLFLMLYNTGARVSEITRVNVGDVVLEERAACVHLQGKGRKQRSVPLWHSTIKAIRGPRLAATKPRPGRRIPFVAQPERQGHDTGKCLATLGSGCAGRLQALPSIVQPHNLATHGSTHNSHAPVAGGRRYQCHRTVAGPRKPRDDPSVRRSELGDERASFGQAP